MEKELETGIILPQDGVVNVEWMKEQLSRADLFSTQLLNYARGQVFLMAEINLGPGGFEAACKELDYTVETAKTYISYLQKRIVLEAILNKFYTPLSLSAAEVIPDTVEDALALCDICVARYGKLTFKNLQKAIDDSGLGHKKMSNSAVGIEAMKKTALHEWLSAAFDMTEEQIIDAGRLRPEGKIEFTEKMANAFDRLEDFTEFIDIIELPIHNSENKESLRFLADLVDAAASMKEFLASEHAYRLLQDRKEQFEQEVYPEIQFQTRQ